MTPLDDAYFPRAMSYGPRWRIHPHRTRSLYFGKVYFGLRTESGGGECVVTKNRRQDESKLC